ncbi:response regulator transcription factor [Mucilaginibacter defluvii]|uniref:Response regulatory domain-containing protein n=1 Tax=Mucilaginibacter defluvii TaxID=1196019 RepID=A0ABP9FWY8_9SPHI
MDNEPQQKTLLIIEDDTDILDILELIFQLEGYKVFRSETGAEIEDLKLMAPHLILLDLRLSAGGQEGAAICLRLKAQESTRHIPIVLLSAEMNISTVCTECGANDYIKKPFDMDHLSSKVRSLAHA